MNKYVEGNSREMLKFHKNLLCGNTWLNPNGGQVMHYRMGGSHSSNICIITLHRVHAFATTSALQEVSVIVKIYWPILCILMKYCKGKQNLTEQNPFLCTTGFLSIKVHNLWDIGKFLTENSSICKAHFILVQYTLQLFIVEGMKNNTGTMQIYFLCVLYQNIWV